MMGFDDGSGLALYMCLGNDRFARLMRWRANKWEAVEAGLPIYGYLWAPLVLDDGGGPGLYAIGRDLLGPPYWLVRWDGSTWNEAFPGMVTTDRSPMCSVDVGDGMKIYGASTSGVLRWDNGAWTDIGAVTTVRLYVFNLGDGPGLYAIGPFSQIGGVASKGLARWNGTNWIDLSSPAFTIFSTGHSTVVFDDGTGPTLYTIVDMIRSGEPWQAVRKWLGPGPQGGWQIVGHSAAPGTIIYFTSLFVFDDGRGPALYVGGGFPDINGVPANRIARYDGQNWEGLGAGFSVGDPSAMAALQTPFGPTLLISTSSEYAGGGYSPAFAMWIGCPNCYANCDGSTVPPRLNVEDFTCFINRFAMQDPAANCTGSTTFPYFSVEDFTCFINRFAAGCP
jgi:trimeric autotransporter adhesin